jgi:hypothetical protein
MKITQQHFDHMKSAIALIWTREKHDAHRQFIVNEGKAKDVEKRLRHDWSYFAKLSPWICDNLYAYADDTHIDTALKRAIKELEASA